jgi:phosphatidate cytidylyltransferase
MLGKRVATALVLLAILLPTIFVLPPLAWGLVTLVFLCVAAWEWIRLLPGRRQPLAGAAALAVAGCVLLVWPERGETFHTGLLVGSSLLTLFWIVVGPRRLVRHDASAGGAVLACVLLFGCWVALYELRVRGTVPLLSSMAVIWVADIAAYFFGRALGRRKLAPAISPGKSWEGAIGGFVTVALIGALVSVTPALSDSLPARLAQGLGLPVALLALIAIASLSIIGDLHESLLKRTAGVKDSGTLLPGHGGVLDRIDALIPTMPAALLIYQLLG